MTQTLNLIEQLKQISDYRKDKGKRHALWLVMILVMLGTPCGYQGYRPLADFSQQHWQTLCEVLELPPQMLNLQVMENKLTSKIEVVRQLIAALAGQPMVFSLDALHCQKKRSHR